MENIIKLTGLTKKYGSFTAVDNLDLSIRKGEIFGLLGPNGAGKSTTILMMLGLTEPSSGSVNVCGINSVTHPVAVKRKVGYMPEDVGFYEDRTGFENLVYTAGLNGLNTREARKKAEETLEKVGLAEHANKKAGKYSRGMRQRLGIADVLIKNPQIIILDEPTLGIDPKGVKELLDLIVRLSKREGLTILLSSHHLHQVQQICDRVGLFVGGKLIAEGDVSALSQKLFGRQPLVIEAGIATGSNGANPEGVLKTVEGVEQVRKNNGLYYIDCSQDASPAIARAIVNAGLDLNYLSKKEFGLDEIYQSYFEGGKAS